MRWVDFYRGMDGEESYLGEGVFDSPVLALAFTLPDVPVVDNPDYPRKGKRPMDLDQAKDLLTTCVYMQPSGKVRLPHFTYWIRWEPKATQTEMEL